MAKRKKTKPDHANAVAVFDGITNRLRELGLIPKAQYVECRYSCRGCGKVEQPVHVMARDRDESLLDFVDRVRIAVYIDHVNNSKGCRQQTADLRIPMLGNGGLGRPVH